MKKRILCISAISIVVAVVLGIAIFFATHVSIRGQYFPRNAPVYDLTGYDLTLEEYTDLCSRFPDSQILWDVPFQGSRYPTTTEKLTLTALSEEDVLLLDHFPQLKQVDGSQCPDLDNLLLLQARRPSCQVLYQVPLGSENCSCLSTAFTAADATAEQLDAALPLLPRLRQLTLEGELPAPEVLLRLQTAFPDVTMTFSMEICGQTCPSAAQTMDFTGLSVTFQELSRLLPEQLPDTNVVLTGTRNIDAGWRYLPNYYLFRDYIGGSFFNQEGIQSRWGFTDGERIMACDKSIHSPPVHQVLAEIIRYRIDNGLPIPGVKNVGSEKAEILYQTVCASGK